jgi:hypothetical protein
MLIDSLPDSRYRASCDYALRESVIASKRDDAVSDLRNTLEDNHAAAQSLPKHRANIDAFGLWNSSDCII